MSESYLYNVASEARAIKREHGFDIVQRADWDENSYLIGAKISGIHAEISEMAEALEKNDLANFAEEGCDVVIQALELIHPFITDERLSGGYGDPFTHCEHRVSFTDKYSLLRNLVFLHGRVSYMYECLRKDEIRTFIKYGYGVVGDAINLLRNLDIDVKEKIRAKMEYNRNRPLRHGGKRL